ncbi:MAG: hypothetical protein NPIRA02_38370 [Nitrospirales bacterium]|nr:MAG: hypothetical protein NPIRA02_38370 [Nitrospirales bacterium]
MAVKVIDASALAAILFAEPEAQKVICEIEQCELAAPLLLPFELANVCLTKQRRHPSQHENLLANFLLLEHMAIQYIEINMVHALLMAGERNLTVYDASYLLLSLELVAPLVTLDKRLANAVHRH